MSNTIVKNKEFLSLLCNTKSLDQRQALLETATPSQVSALSEVALNLYCGRCKLARDTKKKYLLNKNKEKLLRVAATNRPLGRKKRFLIKTHKQEVNQEGKGLFSVLIPLLATVISTAVAAS